MTIKSTKKIAVIKNQNVLSAAALFAAGTPVAVPVEIPEVEINGKPGVLFIRALSARDVLDFAGSEATTPDAQQAAMIKIITKAVVNQDGTPMFASEEDVEKLRDLRFKVFTAIVAAVNEVAGLGGTKAKEEVGKD